MEISLKASEATVYIYLGGDASPMHRLMHLVKVYRLLEESINHVEYSMQ